MNNDTFAILLVVAFMFGIGSWNIAQSYGIAKGIQITRTEAVKRNLGYYTCDEEGIASFSWIVLPESMKGIAK